MFTSLARKPGFNSRRFGGWWGVYPRGCFLHKLDIALVTQSQSFGVLHAISVTVGINSSGILCFAPWLSFTEPESGPLRARKERLAFHMYIYIYMVPPPMDLPFSRVSEPHHTKMVDPRGEGLADGPFCGWVSSTLPRLSSIGGRIED